MEIVTKKIVDNIIMDDQLNLPYGWFDDYIAKVKEKLESSGGSGTEAIVKELKGLVEKMGYFREKDLVHFHKYIIANKNKAKHEQQAKLIILDTIVLEILNARKRNWKKSFTIEKMLKKSDEFNSNCSSEYLISELKDLQDSGTRELLASYIKEEDIDKVSSYLGAKEVEKKLDWVEKERLKGHFPMYNRVANAIEKSDPFFSSFSSEDHEFDRAMERASYGGVKSRFSNRDVLMSEEEFKDRLLLREIKSKYYKKKFELFEYTNEHNREEIDIDEFGNVVKTVDLSNTEKLKNFEKNDENDGLIESNLKTNELNLKIEELERRADISNPPPSLDDIMEEVDMIYEALPPILKDLFRTPGEFYKQRFGIEDLDRRELLWKNFKTGLNRMQQDIHNPVQPSKEIKTDKDRGDNITLDLEKLQKQDRYISKTDVIDLDNTNLIKYDLDDIQVPEGTVLKLREHRDYDNDESGDDEDHTSTENFSKKSFASERKNQAKEEKILLSESQGEQEGEKSLFWKRKFKNLIYYDPHLPILDKTIKQIEHEQGTSQKLTEEEKIEIELYKQTKIDPFYEHYLRDNLSFFTQNQGDYINHMEKELPFLYNHSDIMTGDKIKPESLQQIKYTVREKLQTSDAQRCMASAKRKRSRAVCFLTEGSGKIKINRRDFIEYFSHPAQRTRIVTPLAATNYLCSKDVSIYVYGGGTNGQTEATRLAIAKALVKWDDKNHQILTKAKLLWHDMRKVERKKPGRYKARKKEIYKRR